MSLRVRDLRKRFDSGTVAVDSVSFEVGDGDRLVLLGPSGCGKTTLLRVIAGLERADSGDVSIGGRDVTRMRPAERGIAFAFQEPAVFPHLDAGANLAFGLRSWNIPRAEVASRVHEIARLLEIDGLLDKRTHELSGGERQRVSLGRVLVRRPRLFLLDEPLSSLDLPTRDSLRRRLRSWLDQLGVPTVFVTHDQNEAFALGGRLSVMSAGRLHGVGVARDLLERPSDLTIAAFLGDPPMNLIRARITRAGGAAELEVAGGRIGLPERFRDAPSGEATLGVRAGELVLDGSGDAANGFGFALDARVASVEERVGRSLIVLTIGSGESILASAPAGAPVASRVSLRIDERSVHLFGTDGRRLEESA